MSNKNNKYEYCIATHEDYVADFLDTYRDEDREFNEEFNKFTLKELIDLGIRFYVDLPDEEYGSSSYTDNYSIVSKFKKLSYLIEGYLFVGDDLPEPTENEKTNQKEQDKANKEMFDMINERMETLCKDEIVFRKNLKSNKFSIITPDEIQECFETIMYNSVQNINNNDQNTNNNQNIVTQNNKTCLVDALTNKKIMIPASKSLKYKKMVKEFTDLIESLIEKDGAHVTASSKRGTYDFCIVKKNSGRYNKVKNYDCFKNVKEINNSGFVYENTYENFSNLLFYNLTFKIQMGIVLNVSVTDIDWNKSNDKKYWENKNVINKVYGFAMHNDISIEDVKKGVDDKMVDKMIDDMINNSEMIIEQLNANDVLDSYKKDNKTGKKIKPPKNLIYCGCEKDDFICGFDLE